MLALAAAVCWLIQNPAHSTGLVILDKIKNLWPSKPVIPNEMKNLLSLARKDRTKPKLFLVSRILMTSGILLLWVGLMGWGLNNYYFNPDYVRPDWRGALATVADEAQPGDLLLGFPFHHFEVAQDLYLGGKIWPERAGGWSYVQSGALYFPGQQWGGYADFTSPQTAASPDLKADLARLVQPYRRIWLIAYNDPTNAAVLDWLRDHYQAMPPRYFGPRQTLVLYRFD
jgi:hypothetical protein